MVYKKLLGCKLEITHPLIFHCLLQKGHSSPILNGPYFRISQQCGQAPLICQYCPSPFPTSGVEVCFRVSRSYTSFFAQARARKEKTKYAESKRGRADPSHLSLTVTGSAHSVCHRQFKSRPTPQLGMCGHGFKMPGKEGFITLRAHRIITWGGK